MWSSFITAMRALHTAVRVATAVILATVSVAGWAWPDDNSTAVLSPFTGDVLAAAATDDARDYYLTQVDSLVQESCLSCHRSGATAQSNGARLILSDDADANHSAFLALLAEEDVDGSWVLSKIAGQENHGGGVVASPGSAVHDALLQYLNLLGENESSLNSDNFWQGTQREEREVTLRRAAMLFAGQVPSDAAIAAAAESEFGLRGQILEIMRGRGFHDFIVTGANDRLLVEGLLNGIDFGISTRDRFPKLSELLVSLPEDKPEEYEDYHEEPFLTEGDADWSFRWAITREPLELIAHVVMNDLPYKQILTADFTMVNAFSDLAYRSGAGFSHEFADDRGFYDRSKYNEFRPGRNQGHIPHDYAYYFDEDDGITGFSGYQTWPHSGVISTQAWLTRYPSTDTNRNRARARWTYFHFLGVDIEKSAPRTTDPVALADTNNPTMNNGACTVCHERLDPVAGAYQSFGDRGHYLDQYGGKDALPDAYKCPECYDGERGSTGYKEGDTWYRDMRQPGFEGKNARGSRDSLQWLGYRVATDPRFAEATVRFWWPSVFGAKPLDAPSDAQAPDYDQRLRAFRAQDDLIRGLAETFKASGYSAKRLLTEMAMSPWYRNSGVDGPAIADARSIELETVGRGRLLTPEELDRKTKAVFGRTWRQRQTGVSPHDFSQETALTGHRAEFKGFYGGTDGAAVIERNRDLTPLMSNVTEAMATELACQVVVEDFNRPQEERVIFGLLKDRSTKPGELWRESTPLPGKTWDHDVRKYHVLRGEISAPGGASLVRIEDSTVASHRSTDDQHTWTELTLQEVVFKQNGRVKRRISGTSIQFQPSFLSDSWFDEESDEWRSRGHSEAGVGWVMHSNAWVQFSTTLPRGDYQVEVRLATMLPMNNYNDSILATVSLVALENVADTKSGRNFRAQVEKLLFDSTGRRPSEETLDRSVATVLERADMAARENPWFWGHDSHCDTWAIWRGEELTHDEQWQRYGDPQGTMRGWITFVHGLLTSYAYTHD